MSVTAGMTAAQAQALLDEMDEEDARVAQEQEGEVCESSSSPDFPVHTGLPLEARIEELERRVKKLELRGVKQILTHAQPSRTKPPALAKAMKHID